MSPDAADPDPPAPAGAPRSPSSWGEGAAAYDAEFAGLTTVFADELLDELGVDAGTRFLDVAAGTGALSLPALRRGAAVTATDWSAGMVEVLRANLDRARAAGGAGTATASVMDAARLELPDGSQDAVGSMFGLMFLPDVTVGIAEAARVAVPGGRVGTLTWDLEAFPFHRLVGAALDRGAPELVRPTPPPPDWAAVGHPEGLRGALVRGGLVDVEVRPVVRSWHFEDPVAFFRSLPSWSNPLRPLLAGLSDAQFDSAARAFADVVAESAGPDGGLPAGALLGVGSVA